MKKIYTIVTLKCPSCGKGNLFKYQNPYKLKHLYDMNTNCPLCNQDFEIEPGFYWGAMYLSYILNAFWSGFLFLTYATLAWGHIIEYGNYYISTVVISIVLFAPYTIQLSRSLWIHLWLLINKSGGMFQ